MDTNTFIEAAQKKHGDKYDYSEVEYTKSYEKVKIICPEHGPFWQRASHHMSGHGCPVCSGKMRKTFEAFKEEATKIHEGKYLYEDTNYINSHTLIKITCPRHGIFEQTPTAHLGGNGCPKCAVEKLSKLFSSNTEEFVEKAKKVHGDRYDYSLVEYVNNHTPVKIICPIHGVFEQDPHNHLAGKGCSVCKQSKLELEVSNILNENKIDYEYQWHLPWSRRYSLDFFIPSIQVGIECQGRQHFEEGRFPNTTLEETQCRDKYKFDSCKEHGIDIVYYSKQDEDGQITDSELLVGKLAKLGCISLGNGPS